MEGITGIVHGDMMSAEQREYDRGRRLMTGDTNAAVEGAQRAGADYILVADGHGPMRNIFFEDLHAAAHLMTGASNARDFCQLEGADSRPFEAAVFVGYHAMARTYKAIHPHTIAGVAVSELRLNGKPHGETGLNAAILGSLGIPVVMLSGDTTTCAEARAFLGDGIETVSVKGRSRPQRRHLPPAVRDAARDHRSRRTCVERHQGQAISTATAVRNRNRLRYDATV